MQARADAPSALAQAVRQFAHMSRVPTFVYSLADLDEDGRLDALVLLRDRFFCGSGGCALAIFRGTAHGFRLLSSSTISNEPVRLLPETQYGWRTLVVTSNGTGEVVMAFNGSRYPINPSLQPRASRAQLRSAQRLRFQD